MINIPKEATEYVSVLVIIDMIVRMKRKESCFKSIYRDQSLFNEFQLESDICQKLNII
jgi:hypothetical protein